ncbi:MAG: HEAT repeat domain-containing protein [Candidatus Heimdallarchaeota archaeon]
MSEEAKKLLLRLKKEKKTTKQIDLIEQLKPYNQEEIVNRVLLVHLERKDNDALRLEILAAINYEDEAIVKPLTQIINSSYELQSVKERAITLLGQNKSKKALGVLLGAYRKIKDTKLLDNVAHSLTFFEDAKVIRPLIKGLANDELRLQILTGLARNNYLVLSSSNMIKELAKIEITKNFEKLHHEKILTTIMDEFGYANKEELDAAISNKSINAKISEYSKKQEEINKLLKKVK